MPSVRNCSSADATPVEDDEGRIAGPGELAGDGQRPHEDGLGIEIRDERPAGVEQATNSQRVGGRARHAGYASAARPSVRAVGERGTSA